MMLIGKTTNSRKRYLSIISTPRYDLEDAFAKYGPERCLGGKETSWLCLC